MNERNKRFFKLQPGLPADIFLKNEQPNFADSFGLPPIERRYKRYESRQIKSLRIQDLLNITSPNEKQNGRFLFDSGITPSAFDSGGDRRRGRHFPWLGLLAMVIPSVIFFIFGYPIIDTQLELMFGPLFSHGLQFLKDPVAVLVTIIGAVLFMAFATRPIGDGDQM